MDRHSMITNLRACGTRPRGTETDDELRAMMPQIEYHELAKGTRVRLTAGAMHPELRGRVEKTLRRTGRVRVKWDGVTDEREYERGLVVEDGH
jgi:hypothetical protein